MRRPATIHRRPRANLGGFGSILAALLLPNICISQPVDGVYTIPVYQGSSGSQPRVLRIYAGLNGGQPVPYLLDSGSPNFFATYGSWWPGSPDQVVDGLHKDTFSSGSSFRYNAVTANVTLADQSGSPIVQISHATVAELTKVTMDGETVDYEEWQHVNPTTQTALPDGTFGNFGLGLEGNKKVPGLATLLTQVKLPQGVAPGFLVNTGGTLNSDASITVGVSSALEAIFTGPDAIVLSMGNPTGQIPGPGTSTVPAYNEAQAQDTSVTVVQNGKQTTVSLPTIFDTGGGKNAFVLAKGTGLPFGVLSQLVVSDHLQTVLDYVGTTPLLGGSLSSLDSGGSDPRTNTGISIFYDYVILFNVDAGWVSLLPFSAVDELPFLTNAITPRTTDFTVSGDVTTSAGPVTVQSLAFDTESQLKIGNEVSVTGGHISVGSGTAVVQGGTLSSPGNLKFSGPGSLIAKSNVHSDGDVQVESGTLRITNSLTANQVNVSPGAILGGSGTVYANVDLDGILDPGESIGTISISGNLDLSQSATLQIELASPDQIDRVRVAGTASLEGSLSLIPAGISLEFGSLIPNIVTAPVIHGTFDHVDAPLGFRGRILESPSSISVLVAPATYQSVAQTPNQRAVAKSLDTYIPASSGDQETVSLALDLLSAEQFPNAFDQISPQFYGALGFGAVEESYVNGQMLIQQFASPATRQRGFRQIGMQFPETHADGKQIPSVELDSAQFGSWILGNGIFGNRYDVDNLAGATQAGGGVTLGMDTTWHGGWMTGIYAGYQGAMTNDQNGSSLQANGVRMGSYVVWRPNTDGFYAVGLLNGGVTSYQVRRSIEFSTVNRTARSDGTGAEIGAAMNLGYDLTFGPWRVGPTATAQYSYVGFSTFSETGADSLNLRVTPDSLNSLRTTFGARLAYEWNPKPTWWVVPELRAGWQHEFLDTSQSIAASLDNGAESSFDYESPSIDRDSVWTGVGISARFGPSWNANLWYNAGFGRSDYVSHGVSGGIGFAF